MKMYQHSIDLSFLKTKAQAHEEIAKMQTELDILRGKLAQAITKNDGAVVSHYYGLVSYKAREIDAVEREIPYLS